MNTQFLTQQIQPLCLRLMALLLFTAPVFSQWLPSSHGPYGGNVRDIAIGSAPSYTLYALPGANHFPSQAPSMLLTSSDEGQSWTQTVYQTPRHFFQLLVSPASDQILFAVSGLAIEKSTDGGQTWTAKASGNGAQGLRICKLNPDILYAYWGSSGHILKSTDAGESWQLMPVISSVFQGIHPVQLTIAPNDCDTLYVAHREEFWRSLDGGQHWALSTVQLDIDLESLLQGRNPNWGFSAITTDASGKTLFAAFNPYGLYRSSDRGVSWQSIDHDIEQLTIRELIVDSKQAGVLYALTRKGVWKTTDNGDSWHLITQSLEGVTLQALIFHPDKPDLIYLASSSGIFVSLTGGNTWQISNLGLHGPQINSLHTVTENDITTLYAATSSGAFQLDDRLPHWRPLTLSASVGWRPIQDLSIINQTIWALATPHAPDRHAAWGPINPAQLLHSTDGGQQWQTLTVDIANDVLFNTLSVSSPLSDTLYLNGVQVAEFGNRTFPPSIYNSSDQGLSWQTVVDSIPVPEQHGERFTDIESAVVNPAQPDMLYTGYAYAYNQFGKKTITPLNGIPFPDQQRAVVMAFDPVNPLRQYAGTRSFNSPFQGLYISDDGGASWRISGLNSFSIEAIQLDLQDPNTLYVAYYGGIARSHDGGETWIAMDLGLKLDDLDVTRFQPADEPRSLAVKNGILYAGTRSGLLTCKIGECDSDNPTTTTIVEYYHPQLDHYFLTASGSREIGLNEWQRTGGSFKAWLTPQDAPPSAVAVCRFYSFEVNSHFFSLANSECAATLNAPGWFFEHVRFFVLPADSAGNCPADSEAIYRLYNNRYHINKDSNHRYTRDLKIVEAMQAQNWRLEGVAFCAPL